MNENALFVIKRSFTKYFFLKKVLIICPYPVQLAPSQRFRFEQYIEAAIQHSAELTIKPFLSSSAYQTVYRSGNFFSRIAVITFCYLKRFHLLWSVSEYNLVFIHREATPAGPPVIEWIISKILRKKIIYDFDDAIWSTDKVNEPFLLKLIRWRSKVKYICRWSYKISCGNSYLAGYARQFNSNVYKNPTTIDTDNVHNPDFFPSKTDGTVIIGWTGSHSTLKYLKIIEPKLKMLQEKYPEVGFLIIADQELPLDLKNLIFCKWSFEGEIREMAKMDIGIMPMPDDEWTKGKCGFKALQYMAMKIPAVVSPVGVNKEIVDHGVHGYLCSTMDDWFIFLEKLVLNPVERSRMGNEGRKKVIQYYSVKSNTSDFLSLLQ